MFGPLRIAQEKTPWPDLGLLVALCFVLGFVGGTPYFHPDTLLDNALHTIETGGIPDYYNKPGLIVYLQTIVYYITYTLLSSLHMTGSLGDFSALQLAGYMTTSPVALSIDLPGHLLTLTFSIAGVLVVYLWTRSLTGSRSYGLLAGALISTSLLWVANSHYLTVDIGLGALCIVAMYATALFARPGRRLTVRQLSLLGVLIGLVASAKYNGAIICVPVAAALLPCYRQNRRGWATALAIMAAASALTFLFTNPGLALDTRQYLDTLLFEHNHSSTRHTGYDTDGFAWGYFLFTALPMGFGVMPLLLSAAGAAGLLRSKAGSPEKIALLLFPALYLAFMGAYKLTFDRYMVPMIPFLAILAALGIHYIGRPAAAGKVRAPWQRAAVVVLIAACLLPSLFASVAHVVILDRADTREDLAMALNDSSIDSPALRVSAGPYIMKPLLQSLSQATVQKRGLGTLEANMANAADIIIVDSFSFDRALYDPINSSPAASPPGNFTVVRLSPFHISKDAVPFSPGSLYSPYLPDLFFRDRPGPFIEIYCRDSGVAGKIADACARDGIRCEVLPENGGYYYRMLYAS